MGPEYTLISGPTATHGPSIARSNTTAFWTQSWWRVLFSFRNLQDIIALSQERWPRNLHRNSDVMRHEIVVDRQGQVVGFARWELPKELAHEWVAAQTPTVSEQERAELEKRYQATAKGWTFDVDTSALDTAVNAAKEKYEPQRSYIKLDTISVHPEHQRRGIANKLIQSGLEQAWRLQVDVYVIATCKESCKLYQKLGFEYLWGLSQSQERWGLTDTYDTYILVKHPHV